MSNWRTGSRRRSTGAVRHTRYHVAPCPATSRPRASAAATVPAIDKRSGMQRRIRARASAAAAASASGATAAVEVATSGGAGAASGDATAGELPPVDTPVRFPPLSEAAAGAESAAGGAAAATAGEVSGAAEASAEAAADSGAEDHVGECHSFLAARQFCKCRVRAPGGAARPPAPRASRACRGRPRRLLRTAVRRRQRQFLRRGAADTGGRPRRRRWHRWHGCHGRRRHGRRRWLRRWHRRPAAAAAAAARPSRRTPTASSDAYRYGTEPICSDWVLPWQYLYARAFSVCIATDRGWRGVC